MEFKQVLNEFSLSRLQKHLSGKSNRDVGFITAFRGTLKKTENLARNRQLKNDIRDAGFGFVKIKGKFIEDQGTPEEKHVEEETFIITGGEKDNGTVKGFLKKAGKKFDQDSVLLKSKDKKDAILIGTNTTGFPGLNKEFNIGQWNPNKVGPIMSSWKGKNFVFESFMEEPTFFSRLGLEFLKRKMGKDE